jgi:hypothetical protein
MHVTTTNPDVDSLKQELAQTSEQLTEALEIHQKEVGQMRH